MPSRNVRLVSSVMPGILSGMLALTLCLSGCTSAPGVSASSSPRIASVDGTVITKAEFDNLFNQKLRELSRMAGLPQGTSLTLSPQKEMELRAHVLNALIQKTLVHNKASNEGVLVTEGEVRKFKDELFIKNPNFELMNKSFADADKAEIAYNEMLRDQLLFLKLMERNGFNNIQVPEEEAEAYYKQNRKEFTVPASIQYRSIVFRASVKALQKEIKAANPHISEEDLKHAILEKRGELKAKADKILSEVREHPKQFNEYARKYSEASKFMLTADDTTLYQPNVPPELWNGISHLQAGNVFPDLLNFGEDFMILQVEAYVPERVRPFSEVKFSIIDRLTNDTREQIANDWLQANRNRLLQEDGLKIDPDYDFSQYIRPY